LSEPDDSRTDPDFRSDPGDPRIASGAAWRELVAALGRAEQRVLGPGVPDSPRDRAEGFRHLLRFLVAGHLLCVEHADPDHPRFARMVDPAWQWGLDMPDCLYLYAPLRGDAAYRVWGRRGSAHHVDLQVNWGHFASGDIAAWGTVSSASADQLEVCADGTLCASTSPTGRPRSRQTCSSSAWARLPRCRRGRTRSRSASKSWSAGSTGEGRSGRG
jgi:hypothetical protein